MVFIKGYLRAIGQNLHYNSEKIDTERHEGHTILYKDIVLLDYFAVDDNQRNNGAGSSALRMLLERYLGKRFLLEIEAPDIPSENTPERIRRKAFYLRNGMTVMPFLR